MSDICRLMRLINTINIVMMFHQLSLLLSANISDITLQLSLLCHLKDHFYSGLNSKLIIVGNVHGCYGMYVSIFWLLVYVPI